MMQRSDFESRLTDETRDVFDCVVELGVRVWQPNGVHTTVDDGLVHIFYVLDGILSCQRSTHITNVLPREVLRVGRGEERVLENPSRSDSTTAIHLSLVPNDQTRLSTRHHYFSDDQKDTKLCRVAACERDGRTLSTRAPVDVYLTTLGRYDTLLLDRHASQPLLIVCAHGKVTVNTLALEASDPAMAVDAATATIVGLKPSTVLILRGQESPQA